MSMPKQWRDTVRMTSEDCKSFGWQQFKTTEEVVIPNSDGSVRECVPVEVTAFRDADGEVYLPGESVEKLDRTKARYMGIILPSQLKEFRTRNHKTQEEMCDILGLGKWTWTRWESGVERPSRSLNKLLGVLWVGKLRLDDLAVDLTMT